MTCRCFVRDHELIAISQRDVSARFPQLIGEVEHIQEHICDFHDDRMLQKFVLPDYTYDVYVASNGTVKLVDINAIASTTAPLLFSWDELPYEHLLGGEASSRVQGANQASGVQQPSTTGSPDNAGQTTSWHSAVTEHGTPLLAPNIDFRILTDPSGLQPGQKLACGMPFDMLMLQDGGGSDLLSQLQSMQEQQQQQLDEAED